YGESTTGAVNETRVLDFNLARRSAVVINRIIGQVEMHPDVTSGLELSACLINEVDLDPDNVEVEFANAENPDAVVVDSSRAFRQLHRHNFDTAAGLSHESIPLLKKDWHMIPVAERPISITNLRHTMMVIAALSQVYHVEVEIDYFIVELSLVEIGILNASRR
ncbi:unnamed protein product, partial [marine sediment metagenome]